MKTKRVLLPCLLGVLLLAAAITGYGLYSFKHMTIVDEAHLKDAQVAIKGSLGEAMFEGAPSGQVRVREGTGLDALLAPSESSGQGEGLIAAYKRDPERFKRYSELLDTALNARLVGNEVFGKRVLYHLPMSSSDLPLQADKKYDAWGHPYCVSAFRDTVVVVSGGPRAASFSCEQRRTTDIEIGSAKRSVFQASTSEVVALVDPNDGREQAHSGNQ